MTFDITDTLAPTSDQLDAVDLLGGSRIFTIERVSKGNAEQPVQVHLAEFPRPWRPGKSMRRVLAACWGVESAQWAGRHVELYCDATVKFGGEAVGGTRISRLSHIDGPQKIPLLVTRGKSAVYTVTPLTDADVVAALRNEWKSADDARKKEIEAQVAALQSSGAGDEVQVSSSPGSESVADSSARPSAPESPICPECAAKKCQNCEGQAWDNAADEPTACACAVAGHAS